MLVLEAGRPDWRFDVFLHMPAALTFPIGSPIYDWGYRSEPEPFMHGRRVYHARGKVLGGSSSINGMIFQRGNALDYERWADVPGHGRLGLRPLPALLPQDGDGSSPLRPMTRTGATTGRWSRARPGREPALRRLLRGGPAGRLRPDRRRQRLPPGGLRAVRPEHPSRPPALRGDRLPQAGPAGAGTSRSGPRPWSPRSPSTAGARPGSSTGPAAGITASRRAR